MYTIQNAASVLGVSIATVRRWIKQDGIETELLETDRKRIYMTYDNVIALADKHQPLPVKVQTEKKDHPELKGLYSLAEAARILGVKCSTVREWINRSDIERQLVKTDRRRLYVSYSDLLILAEAHNRTIAYNKATTKQDGSVQEKCDSQGEKLYTVADAALFLGATEDTVRSWLSVYGIEKRTVEADSYHIYIAYRDIILLAQKQKREPAYPINTGVAIKEARYRLDKIEGSITELKEHIRGSLYIGK